MDVPVASPAITIPPGNQPWNWFSFVVLLSGKSAVTSGFPATSTKPLPR